MPNTSDPPEVAPNQRVTRAVWLLLMGGAVLRILAFFALRGTELDPDAGNYLNLSRQFSWTAPLAGSYGEPLWIALVKAVSAPFGYSEIPYRLFTTLISIVAVALAWPVFARLLPRRAAIVALAFIALNGLLVFIAPRGLREDLVMVLVLVVVIATLRLAHDEGRGLGAVLGVAALCMVRLELGLFMLVVMIAIAVFWKPLRRVTAAGLLISALITVPWLVATGNRFGDPMYHSSYAATYFAYEELDDRGIEHPPLSEAETTWGEYYLDLIGPAETARRFVIGMPSLVGGLLYNTVFPIRPVRFEEIAPRLSSLIPYLRIAATAFAIAATGALLASLRAWRSRTVWLTWLGLLAGLAAYAPLSRHLVVSYRLVAFTLIPMAMLLGIGSLQAIELIKRRDGSTTDH